MLLRLVLLRERMSCTLVNQCTATDFSYNFQNPRTSASVDASHCVDTFSSISFNPLYQPLTWGHTLVATKISISLNFERFLTWCISPYYFHGCSVHRTMHCGKGGRSWSQLSGVVIASYPGVRPSPHAECLGTRLGW